MEFIYADQLKQKFSVYGHFYDLEIDNSIFRCRSTLEIILKSDTLESTTKPCAVVVMMNPGSSCPADANYTPKLYTVSEVISGNWEKQFVPTKPDNAQYQIMRLMLLKKWKHVRILNLSDLRNGNSKSFSLDYIKASKLDSSNPHSITHINRLQELQESCSDIPVIAAWGTSGVLFDAARAFLSHIKVRGLSLDFPWYRYPSPYRKEQKIKWLEDAINELKMR